MIFGHIYFLQVKYLASEKIINMWGVGESNMPNRPSLVMSELLELLCFMM